MRLPLSLLLATALALSGCVGEDPPLEETTAAAPAEPEAAAAPEPESSAAEGEPNAPTAAQADDAPTTALEPFSYEGELGILVCAPLATLGCAGYKEPVTPKETDHPIPSDRVPVFVDLNVTWEPAADTTRALRVWVQAMKPCGEGCIENAGEFSLYGHGTSPMRVVGALPELPESAGWYVMVRPANAFDEPVYGELSRGQPFSVAGALTVLAG